MYILCIHLSVGQNIGCVYFFTFKTNTAMNILMWPLCDHRFLILVGIYIGIKLLGTVVLEKTLESPLDCKEIQPGYPKGDESWVFIGGTDVEAEIPILWPPDAENWLIWKDPGAAKDWGQEEKGTTEDQMFGWHHWHNGREFGWTLGVGDGQGGLVLQFMGLQRVRQAWVTEVNWIGYSFLCYIFETLLFIHSIYESLHLLTPTPQSLLAWLPPICSPYPSVCFIDRLVCFIF